MTGPALLCPEDRDYLDYVREAAAGGARVPDTSAGRLLRAGYIKEVDTTNCHGGPLFITPEGVAYLDRTK